MTTAEDTKRGLRWVLFATAVAGGLGYVTQLVAPRMLDDAAYVAFSVLWSTVYLSVSAMSGVQQEVTRATRPSRDHAPSTVLRTFTLVGVGAVLIAACVLGLALGAGSVPIPGLALSGVIAVGLTGYLLTAVLSGVLYGIRLWRDVALVMILDGAFRTAFLLFGFWLHLPVIWLACGIAFPFGLAFLVTWMTARSRVVGAFALDVGFGPLSRNVLSTVIAAACNGAMISGLPLLIGLTGHQESSAELGAVMLAITLSRAPIVVPILALQSFLISAVFRGRAQASPARLLALVGAALGAVLALAALAYGVGPWLLQLISAGRYEINPLTMALIVASAGLVGLMCVTGPALVAEHRHTANVVGWVIAAALTVGGLLLPLPLVDRIEVALIVPPLVGMVVHVGVLLARRAPGGSGRRKRLR